MYRQMPIYNEDLEAYLKQMYEWHTQMANYKQQLRVFHLNRANHFQNIVNKKEVVLQGNGTT